ncbi:hypothetical protein BGY98DRAFT_594056 [Russula aff. rugulosa BPL654]|nr:hypothetical protein BGY98DRAFT_594056 [Russula aff. rugulosa BPL654]
MGVWRCTYCTNYYCILGCLLRRLINVHRYVYSILSRTSHCDTDGDSTSQRTTQEPETACKSDETRSSQSQAPGRVRGSERRKVSCYEYIVP